MRTYVFDAYGTLFDVHAAIARHAQRAGPEAERFSEIWRTKQLEYTWTLTLAGHYVDFWTLTERALDYALARVPSVDRSLRPKLLDAYLKLDAFADAVPPLTDLKKRGARLAILSNGSPRMLAAAVERPGWRTSRCACCRSTPCARTSRGRRSMRWSREVQRSSRKKSCLSLPTDGTLWARLRSDSTRSGSIARACRTSMRICRRCTKFPISRRFADAATIEQVQVAGK